MSGYLLDTNHVTAAIRPGSALPARLREAMDRDLRFGVCVPVLCEVEAGIHGLSRPGPHRQALTRLLARLRIWPLDRATAEIFGQVYQDLRSRGRVLSQVDMMAAALARQMDLTLLTADQDFDAIPALRRENWLVP